MNKKGFTLIELLAIIVILAIIAVITVPIILNIIDNASKQASVDSAYGYKDAIDKFGSVKSLQDTNYTIPSGTYYVDGTTGYLEGTNETLNIAFSGTIPSSGMVKIGNNGKVEEVKLCINNYMVTYHDKSDANVVKVCTPVKPGLYDVNNNLVVTYDQLVSEYGFDPTIDGTTSSRIGKNILANYSNGAKLVLPDTITRIGSYMFYAANIETVVIPSSVTSIGRDSFANSSISSITIPSSVVNIEESAFSGCGNLTNVTFENGSKLENIGKFAFVNVKLSPTTIPSSVTSIGYNAFLGTNILYYTGNAEDTNNNDWGALSINPYIEGDFVYNDNTKTVLEIYLGTSSSVTIPSSVTSIGNKAFYEKENLTSVTLHSGITSIEESAFSESGLTSITIPSSVTSIGYMAFYKCSDLTSVTFENGSQLTTIDGNVFYNTNLTSLTIPSSVTSIGGYAFNNIKIIYYTGNATDTYNNNWGAIAINPYIEGDFAYNNNTKTVLQVYLGTSSSVTIPSSVTSIGAYAFYGNPNLTSVTIPSSVTSLGDASFSLCSNLTSVTFESGSQLTNIERFVFSSTGLNSITIPTSVTNIGMYAFSQINTVYYAGNATDTYHNNWGAKNIVRNY